MRKKGIWLLYPVFALLLVFSLAVPALSVNADGDPVPLPHNFYGSVIVGTELALAETEVKAEGVGVMTGIEGNPLTTTEAGQYGGPGALDPKLRVQGYIVEGTEIEFYVGGERAQCRIPGAEDWQDTYPWHSAGMTELDLKVFDITAPTFTSVAVSDSDEFYKAGDTISFNVDLGEAGLTVTADLTVLDTALPADFALSDDEDGTYSGTTSALSSETMVEEIDTAVTLTATDATGNLATDDSLTLTIDKTPPVISATSPVTDADIKAGFSVDYTLDEAVASGTIAFTATEPAGTTQTYALVSGDLASGAHTIAEADLTDVTLVDSTVYEIAFDATDPAGNPASTVTNTGITYDTGAPTVTIDVTTPTNSPTQTVTGTMEAGATVVLSADTTATCGDVTELTATTWSCEVSGLVEDSNVITATATDAAGNTATVTDTIVLDTGAPTVTIDIPDYINAANEAAVPVTITSDEDGTYTYTISGTSGSDVTDTGSIIAATGVELTVDLSGLGEGSVTADASVEDAAGNTGNASQDTATKDTGAPTVTIDSVPSLTNTPTQTLTGTMEEGATVVLTSAEATCDDVTELTATTWSCDVSLVEDSNVITATATDAAENTATAEATIVLDTVAPTVTIDIPDYINAANEAAVPVTITSDEDGTYTYTISGTSGSDVTDTGSIIAATGVELTVDLSGLGEGSVTADASVEDAAGNTGNASQDTATKDTGAPTVTIDSVPSPTNTPTQTLTGTMSEGATVTLTSTEATCGDVTYDTTTWSCEVSLVEGSNVITATATADADTATATATIVLDTAAPTVTSKSPEAGASDVAVGVVITATFGEDVLERALGDITIPGANGVSATLDANTITIVHDDFDLDTSYTVTIPAEAVEDLAGNLNAEYTWNFTTAVGNLGDEIDKALAAGEDTLVLGAGTYSGDVTINQSITITGSEEGTTISGGIHVAPLGSNVTIENLTITDYTDYGIWFEEVKTNDVFIIRNNTILGVEGTEIGIQVDKVKAGGSLTIEQNSISGNQIGIKLLEDVVDSHVRFNNIVGNEVGLELLVVGEHMVGASMNWWGDISGPEEENENPGGIGDKIELADSLGYYPWLTRDFQTAIDDNIAYFGFPMVHLNTGWNVISTPIALDPGADTWEDYVALGDGLAIDTGATTYYFDAENQVYGQVLDNYQLEPCDAIYVKMAEPDIASILYSPDISVPSKTLYVGWNLVGLAYRGDPPGLKANEALVSVEEVTGGLTGYRVVVSPPLNQPSWIYTGGAIADWDGQGPPPDGWMLMTNGYWVFMLNDGTLAGFTFTPVSLD